ncbi:hypothetical protein GWD52_12245 [Enterobacteriaceae bacterium 4M9]|nr:hypothetical protein [Enterobacteriaceae bacterium 4M9]
MTTSTLTLNLSEPVTQRLLPDIEALLAPTDFSVLLNTLSGQPETTIACSQTQEACSLLAAAIITWLRLCRMCIWHDTHPVNVQALNVQSLFTLLMQPHAHLRLALC